MFRIGRNHTSTTAAHFCIILASRRTSLCSVGARFFLQLLFICCKVVCPDAPSMLKFEIVISPVPPFKVDFGFSLRWNIQDWF
jgi:hypothetical protein